MPLTPSLSQHRTPCGAGTSTSRHQKAAWASVALWILIWAGYNTGPWVVARPGFPASKLEFFQGIRAFFPQLAGWLALLWLLLQQKVKSWTLEGPLGLMLLFSLVGVVSSLLFSPYEFQSAYWGLAFASTALVAIVILSNERPVEAASALLTLSEFIAVFMMAGIIVGMPLLGGSSVLPGDPLALHSVTSGYATAGFLGMAGTRNTGFARYAAVAGLAALGRIWRGKPFYRLLWLGVLVVAGYCLFAAQGRSEILGFAAGSFIILMLRRSRRAILVVWGVMLTALMALGHVFDQLWDYGTRTGHFDPSLSGRTVLWQQGWVLFKHSPWIGLGFQADRYFPPHQQISNTLMHALVQTGLLGTLAFMIAMILAIVLMVKLYVTSQTTRSAIFRDEVPGLLAFFIVLSITESTAFFSASWLLLAPVLAYIQVLAWQQKALRAKMSYARRFPHLAGPGPALRAREAAEGH